MFLIPCGNHAHIWGGSVAEILMSTMAYGWVECCSDIASCGKTPFQDKYFLVLNSAMYLHLNYYEIIMNILNAWMC